MDENKIAIVVYKQDDAAYENLMQQVSALKIPDIGGKAGGGNGACKGGKGYSR